MLGETLKLSNGHKLGGDEDLVLENELDIFWNIKQRTAETQLA